jgi:hypothetical protein
MPPVLCDLAGYLTPVSVAGAEDEEEVDAWVGVQEEAADVVHAQDPGWQTVLADRFHEYPFRPKTFPINPYTKILDRFPPEKRSHLNSFEYNGQYSWFL